MKREPWQEGECPYTTSGICLANCQAACLCQNGERAQAQLLAFLNRRLLEEERDEAER